MYSSGLDKKGRALCREERSKEDTKAEETDFQNVQTYVVPKAKLTFPLPKCHEIAKKLGNT